MEHLVCGAFHCSIAPAWIAHAKDNRNRIFSSNPDNEPDEELSPVGVDYNQVFDGQDAHTRFNFLAGTSKKCLIITLTQQEKQLLILSGLIHPERLVSFEERYPFWPNIKFVNNARKNHTLLLKLLKSISHLDIKGGATDYWSRKFMHKVARKIKKRSALDASFAHASFLPYQEAFKLSETRPGRRVIALDFNSMYGSCMSGEFSDPSHLIHQQINHYYQSGTFLATGLYRVHLCHPVSEFIKKYHALKYVHLNNKYAFTLTENQHIEVLLHSNEIVYYSNHFSEIYIYEGIFSTTSISHPLLKDVQRIYSQRLHYKRQKNITLERLNKLQLAIMHGSVKRKKYRTNFFRDFKSAHHFLQKNFGLNCPDSMSPTEFLSHLSDGHRFTIEFGAGISIRYLTHHDDSIVFSLYSQVIANARVKMMQTIDLFHQFPELEICYCNIDSIHISLPAESISEFYRFAAPLIGEDMGKLKIEAQADQGYWFEPGRYWLIRENSVVLFKNQGVHNPYVDNPFQDGRSYYKIFNEDGYSVPIKCRKDIAGTLTYKKKLRVNDAASNMNFERYRVEDLASFSQIQHSMLQEIESSSGIKIDLFNILTKRYR